MNTQDNRKSVIEALLLASEKPLPLEQIRVVLDNLDLPEARRLIEELKLEYEEANRGIRIAEIAGGFQMITAAAFAPFLKKLFKDRNTEKLSKPALETLAIIAYKQPLTRLEIELLRNVNVDGVIKSLAGKNLIRIAGRKKAPGRPCVYGTTRQFLEHFGLKSLDDLPKIEEFSALAEKKDLVDIELEEEKKTEALDEPQKLA
ncbi:MAG: SMC-Scp complex subunit ScpB [Candidatus Omnitrophota bacterium]|jgi:segregation and condensation protein B|nr:SMC-Scp complex subunit ScpB [Candidatus Omnitrophota bacterium]MDD5517999.1 SMC-Scp complex subunit ScpB [Candidatus Omnitrophota bacterium]